MECVSRHLETAWYLREGQDYFYWLRPFQLIAGYPTCLRTFLGKLVRILRFAGYLAHFGSFRHKLLYTLYQPENINYMSFVSGGVGLMCATLILMIIFTVHHKSFQQLKDFLNDGSFAREHPLAGSIRESCYRWSNCFILGPQCSIVVIFVQLMITGQHHKRHMMLMFRGQPIGANFDQALYASCLYVPSVAFFMACFIINALMVGFLGEMKLLATCLGELDDTVRRRLADQGGERFRRCFWIAYNAELRRCAIRHGEVFTMLTKLQRLSSLVFLQHHVFSLTLVASGCYVTLRGNALSENIIFTEYLISVVLLYSTFCLLVEKLQDMNNCIGDRLYATEWMLQLHHSPNLHPEYRSTALTIALLRGRSQQRIRFTCGSINEVSMAKFTDFVNVNYSIVMFFININ